jgi:hypothetical protein
VDALCQGHVSQAQRRQDESAQCLIGPSIFVTWLNGVPYDTRDSPFLQGMKLTAAEYQTHSLAIANNPNIAAENLAFDFCRMWASSARANGRSEHIGCTGKEESMISKPRARTGSNKKRDESDGIVRQTQLQAKIAIEKSNLYMHARASVDSSWRCEVIQTPHPTNVTVQARTRAACKRMQ